jgi:hypothetical protein
VSLSESEVEEELMVQRGGRGTCASSNWDRCGERMGLGHHEWLDTASLLEWLEQLENAAPV